MPNPEHIWPSDAFDAIHLMGLDGEFQITGTDDNQVTLEADMNKWLARQFSPRIEGRWLLLSLATAGDAEVSLRLPRSKAWVVDVSLAKGEVSAEDLHARLSVRVGQGEVQVNNSRGIFSIVAGQGEVQMEGCAEADAPEAPPRPQAQFEFTPPIPPTPPPVPEPPEPPMMGDVPFPHMRRRIRRERVGDWADLEGQIEDWAQWGAQFGGQARRWVEGIVGQVAEHTTARSGVNLHLGQGSVEIQSIQARTCAVQVASGDVEIERGRIENLDISVSQGDAECRGVLPAGEWSILVRHGDIALGLPSDTQARLDAATRHGDIDSQVPLVRVGRPGREARHGGRMVGTAGRADNPTAQVNLEVVHGDIQIEWQSGASGYAASSSARTEETIPTPRPTTAPAQQTDSASADRAEPVPQASEWTPPPGLDTQLAILQALSHGEITVDEAEKLLRSLNS